MSQGVENRGSLISVLLALREYSLSNNLSSLPPFILPCVFHCVFFGVFVGFSLVHLHLRGAVLCHAFKHV